MTRAGQITGWTGFVTLGNGAELRAGIDVETDSGLTVKHLFACPGDQSLAHYAAWDAAKKLADFLVSEHVPVAKISAVRVEFNRRRKDVMLIPAPREQ
jgi:hypothetical protein